MKSIVLAISLILGTFVLFAQENNVKKSSEKTLEYQYGKSGFIEGKQYVITIHDGVEYIGEILSDDGHEILMETKTLGKVYIPKFEIKSIIEIIDKKSIIYNEYQPTGPFTTRYSFTTNALPIKKGENYGMINLYGPEAHLALTNKLNIGIMTSWIASPLVLATKYSFKSDESKVNISFGTLLATTGYLNNFKGYGGIHWLNITIGDRKNNFTFSGGYSYLQTGIINDPAVGVYTEEEYFEAEEQSSSLRKMIQGPVFSVAGIFKVGAKYSFVFDSMIGYFNYEKVSVDQEFHQDDQEWIYTVTRKYNAYTTALFLMPGVRFQKTDSKAFQICVAGVSMFGDSDESFPIPMCTWFYKF